MNRSECGDLDSIFPAPIHVVDLPVSTALLVQGIPCIATTLLWFACEFSRPIFATPFRAKGSGLGLLTSAANAIVAWRVLESLSCAGVVDPGWRVAAAVLTFLAALALLVLSLGYPRAAVCLSLLLAAGSVFGSWATEGEGLVRFDDGLSFPPPSPPFVATQMLWCLLAVCLLSRISGSRTCRRRADVHPSAGQRRAPAVTFIDTLYSR